MTTNKATYQMRATKATLNMTTPKATLLMTTHKATCKIKAPKAILLILKATQSLTTKASHRIKTHKKTFVYSVDICCNQSFFALFCIFFESLNS